MVKHLTFALTFNGDVHVFLDHQDLPPAENLVHVPVEQQHEEMFVIAAANAKAVRQLLGVAFLQVETGRRDSSRLEAAVVKAEALADQLRALLDGDLDDDDIVDDELGWRP